MTANANRFGNLVGAGTAIEVSPSDALRTRHTPILTPTGSFQDRDPYDSNIDAQIYAVNKNRLPTVLKKIFPDVTFQDEAPSEPRVRSIEWDAFAPVAENSIAFSFRDSVLESDVASQVLVRVSGFDGSDQYAAHFDASDPALTNLAINVNLHTPPIYGGGGQDGGTAEDANKKIKGKLVSMNKTCTLKSSVVIQAKVSNAADWRVVSSGVTDKAENFVLPYPYGSYASGRALVSLDSNSITTLHMQPNYLSMPDSFLYILVNPPADKASDADCNCSSTVVADRLPDQEELIRSNQYTQDLGGGCMNLTTPNRTLKECNYTALVRTSDTGVPNYQLNAALGNSEGEIVYSLELVGNGKVQRKTLDIDYQIDWHHIQGAGLAGSYGGFGGTVAVAEGAANANSTASQSSCRALSGHFDEKIRQGVNQNAQSYRQRNSSVVTTVQEGQSYEAETIVVANHNHYHTITIIRDDRFRVQETHYHMNQNLEYYNRVLWYSIDEQRRFMLLDGFHIQNQVNAIETFLSNQQQAKSFAEMATTMAVQTHNTSNSPVVMDDSGVITRAEAGELVREHIESQINGGQRARDGQEETKTQESAKKPTPADNTKSRDDGGSRWNEDLEASKHGILKTAKTCWAFAATMMINWYENRAMFPEEAMAQAGQDYVDKVKNDEGLPASEKHGLIDALDMVAEGRASFPPKRYVELMRTYGPIWVTIDSSAKEGLFSPHAKSGLNTFFTFVNPSTGKQEAPQKFQDFLKVFEQMASDNPGKGLFPQVVHFKKPIEPGEGYQLAVSWNEGTPVHEHLTLAALKMSSKMKLPPGTTLEKSAPSIKEILRGVIWNDDPECLLFDQDRNDNWNFASGAFAGPTYSAANYGSSSRTNLMGRFHFYDLQFLWGMYRLALGSPTATSHMEDAALQSLTIEPTDQRHRFFDRTTFPAGSQSFRKLPTGNARPQGPDTVQHISDRGNQGGKKTLIPNDQYKNLIIQRRALGSILHLIQNSYARGHCWRLLDPASKTYGPIKISHTYKGQNRDMHAHYDQYTGKMDPSDIKTFAPIHGAVEAIEACAALIDLWADRKD
ncbi:MAG: hypothetical protein Q9210_001655 [Variospora velana]